MADEHLGILVRRAVHYGENSARAGRPDTIRGLNLPPITQRDGFPLTQTALKKKVGLERQEAGRERHAEPKRGPAGTPKTLACIGSNFPGRSGDRQI